MSSLQLRLLKEAFILLNSKILIMKYILFALLLYSNISIAQSSKSWKIDTMYIPMEEYTVKDKQLCVVLDSLLSLINEPLLDGVHVPYSKKINIKQFNNYKEITLGLSKYYDEVDTIENQFVDDYPKYFFKYKGMQIKINVNEKDSKSTLNFLAQYFDLINYKGSYKCLVFKSTKDSEATWSDTHFISQLISYRVYPNRMYLFKNCWEDRVLWR